MSERSGRTLIVDPVRVAPVPWHNGLGATRELASLHDDDGALLWRISLASLSGDAAFSDFPGLDRLFVALGAVALEIDGERHVLDHRDQVRFAGTAAVCAHVPAPTQALNVMTRSGRARASVTLRASSAPAPDADVTVDLGADVADIRITPTALAPY